MRIERLSFANTYIYPLGNLSIYIIDFHLLPLTERYNCGPLNPMCLPSLKNHGHHRPLDPSTISPL